MKKKNKDKIMDLIKEGMPSLLCSGCWPMEELDAYLEQCKEKKESENSLSEKLATEE